MLTPHDIWPDAVFVADAHANDQRTAFIDFLRDIERQDIQASQLFIMGDCFDFLSSSIAYSVLKNKKAIRLIRRISQKIPTYYFEGNHDFNLTKLFPNVKVFDISLQPAVFTYKSQRIALLHGDKFVDGMYKIYSKLVRCDIILKFLNIITFNFKSNYIVKKILQKQLYKNICIKKNDFVINRFKLIENKILILNTTGLVEGHFHQNVETIKNGIYYKNIGAFACDKSFFKVQSHEIFKLSEIKIGEARGER